MAIRHIREAFNQEAGDAATCQQAFLDYVSSGINGSQRQVITLTIAMPDNTIRTMQTPVHNMGDDPNEMVRVLARELLDEIAGTTPGMKKPVALVLGAAPTGATGLVSEVGPNPHPDGSVGPSQSMGEPPATASTSLPNPFMG